MTPLLLSILANAVVDFLLQSDSMVVGSEQRFKRFFKHGAALFLTLLLFLHGYQWPAVLGYAALLAGIHLAFDLIKMLIDHKDNRTLNLFGFIIQQMLLILAVMIVWPWFNLRADQGVLSFYANLFSIKSLPSITGFPNSSVAFVPEQLIIAAIIYIYICFGGAILIDNFLNWIRKRDDVFPENKQERTGKWIGILERIIVLSLTINNALGSVAFIFTAKSIARFSELDDRNFAEYYIIGTLASITLAIGGGLILNYLLAHVK